MRIGLLSDTHGFLDDAVFYRLADYDGCGMQATSERLKCWIVSGLSNQCGEFTGTSTVLNSAPIYRRISPGNAGACKST